MASGGVPQRSGKGKGSSDGRAALFWKPGSKRPEQSTFERELEKEGLSVVYNPHASLSRSHSNS